VAFEPSSDVAYTVLDAVAKIADASFSYDLVITDMVFEPDEPLGGFTVLDAIRRRSDRTRAIILTGYSDRISVAQLIDRRIIYQLSESTWVQKGATSIETGKRLAQAIETHHLPMLKSLRAERWSKDRPYRISLTDRIVTIIVPDASRQFEVALRPAHVRELRALAESERPLDEAHLIAQCHRDQAKEMEVLIAQALPRDSLLAFGRVVESPIDKCATGLTAIGTSCSNYYSTCFPNLAPAAGRAKQGRERGIELKQCPLNYRLWGHPPKEDRAMPQHIRGDITQIRQSIAAAVGQDYPPLARDGGDNDLLRTAHSGYWLAATVDA
jgi:CheY-like chemotaxis protein